MKDKFKQTSIFSTFKKKLDIFKWQAKKPNREEPILLGIKSTRTNTNCEVSNEFEYFDPRRRESRVKSSNSSNSNIYCSVQSINHQEHIYNSAENICDPIKPIIKKPVKYRNNNNNTSHTNRNDRYNKKSKVKEIEIFERKFLTPLSNQSKARSTTTIVIKDDSSCQIRTKVSRQPKMMASSSSSSSSRQQSVQQHVRVLRTSSKDSDCDSGAYSRSSSPEPVYERLDRSCEKLEEKFPLQSPNLVLSVIKETDNYKAKVNSNLLLSCLNEAGKSSLFCSLDSLNHISTQPRYFKKNPAIRKLSVDPPVSVSVGNNTQLSLGLGSKKCSKSETDLNKLSDKLEMFSSFQRSHQKYLKAKKSLLESSEQRIRICDCQVTVNGQHICNLITQPK